MKTQLQADAYGKAASEWVTANWHGGFRVAGADNAYTARMAFMAGAAYTLKHQPPDPELISALKTLVGYGREDMGHQQMCDYVTEIAEALIAKAEGRA